MRRGLAVGKYVSIWVPMVMGDTTCQRLPMRWLVCNLPSGLTEFLVHQEGWHPAPETVPHTVSVTPVKHTAIVILVTSSRL